MANQRAFDLVSVRRAIEACGASPAAIARELGCTRSTVYAYLRKYPELKAAFEAARGSGVAERTQYTREQFEQAITKSWGVKATIAQRLGCSRQTVDNALDRWPDLRERITSERESIVDLAESKLTAAINQGELRAITFTLETLGKARGWSRRTEVTGADGAALLGMSPDTVALIESMGMDLSEVVKQFETMVRAAAVANG